MTDSVELTVNSLHAFLTRLFERYGFDGVDAAFIAETLVDSERKGIVSHGLQRVSMYDGKLRQHTIDPGATATIVSEDRACAVMDGQDGMGQLIARDAMNLAITRASEYGIGMVAVRGSNHFGTAGYYARAAANKGLIGIVATNSNPLVVPTHANMPALGTNPIAFAVGIGEEQFSYDAATCTASLGKIEVCAQVDQLIPGTWAASAAGASETDPSRVLRNLKQKRGGGLTPLGGIGEIDSGYKGYGLSLIVEILTGILAGGLTSIDLAGRQVCHWFAAIDLTAFGGAQAVSERMAKLFLRLRALPSADGQPVLIPGDKERAHEARLGYSTGRIRDDDGHAERTITVNRGTFRQLRSIAERAGLAAPEPYNSVSSAGVPEFQFGRSEGVRA